MTPLKREKMTKKKGRTFSSGLALCFGVNGLGAGTYVGDDSERWSEGTDPLAPRGLEEEEEYRHQEDVAGCGGVAWETRRVVPEQPVDEATDDGEWDLGHNVGGAKGNPTVDSRRELSCLPKSAVLVEFGDHAVDDGWWNDENHKGGEHPVLHVLYAVAQFPECKAVEDADDDGNEELAVKVRRVPPILPKHPLCQCGGLEPNR